MKAVLYDRYGDRDVMQLTDVPPAAPGAGEVRVRVQAVSVNPIDGKIRRGEQQLLAGGHFPKRPGMDFAGVVDAVGDAHGPFAVGDAVFGGVKSMSEGALGESAIVPVGAIAHRPASLDALNAAAVPVAAIAALQVLRDVVKVNPRDRVLVNGCTGGVGLFALQLARRMGAHVTGVCGTDGVATARAFGADEVIDYKKVALTSLGERYDALIELSGHLTFEQAEPLLDEQGRYVDFSPTPASLIGNTIANPFRSHQHLFAMTKTKRADLEELARLFEAGALKAPPITEFALEQFREAYALAEQGGVIGKVVIRVAA